MFTSLSILCMNIKKTFLLIFCRVGDSVGVSGKVQLCEKPVVQVKSLLYFSFHIDFNLSHKNISFIQIFQKKIGFAKFLKLSICVKHFVVTKSN